MPPEGRKQGENSLWIKAKFSGHKIKTGEPYSVSLVTHNKVVPGLCWSDENCKHTAWEVSSHSRLIGHMFCSTLWFSLWQHNNTKHYHKRQEKGMKQNDLTIPRMPQNWEPITEPEVKQPKNLMQREWSWNPVLITMLSLWATRAGPYTWLNTGPMAQPVQPCLRGTITVTVEINKDQPDKTNKAY